MPKGFTKFVRKEPKPMDEVVAEYIKAMKLTSGLNQRRVFEAWDAVSGAGSYTISRFYRGEVLYIGVGSSVMRSRLLQDRERLLEEINRWLLNDNLFVKQEGKTIYVKSIVLK